MVLPKWKGVVVPVRQARSHSASVGKRKWPRRRASGAPRAFRASMKAPQSCQLTLSTGSSPPRKCDGFAPMTASHWACVTSVTPM